MQLVTVAPKCTEDNKPTEVTSPKGCVENYLINKCEFFGVQSKDFTGGLPRGIRNHDPVLYF